MVNRDAREAAEAAEIAIRNFLGGKIDNDEFESQYPAQTGDLGLLAIENVLWFFYDDFKVERFTGPILPEAQAMVDHIYLFLLSNCEYEYIQYKFFRLRQDLDAGKNVLDPVRDNFWSFARTSDL